MRAPHPWGAACLIAAVGLAAHNPDPLLAAALAVAIKNAAGIAAAPLCVLVAAAALYSGATEGLQPRGTVITALLAVAAVEL